MISYSGNAFDSWEDGGFADRGRMLAVNSCGYQKLLTRDLVRDRRRGRVDYQLIYFVGGRGTFRFGDRLEEAAKGQIVLYAPGQPQYYRYAAKDGAEAYWLHFTGYGAEELVRRFGLTARPIHTVGMLEELPVLFKKMIRELNMKQPYGDEMAAACLHETLALIGRTLATGRDPRRADPYAVIRRAMARLHETYNEPHAVAELAKACNLSLYRFIHKFKAATGTTPLQYLTSIRMNEAKKLLAETSLTVKEVAAIVGYDNPLYFSRVFAASAGMPPSRYRDRMRQGERG